LLGTLVPPLAADECLSPDVDRAALDALKKSNFEVADDDSRHNLALTLLTCPSVPVRACEMASPSRHISATVTLSSMDYGAAFVG